MRRTACIAVVCACVWLAACASTSRVSETVASMATFGQSQTAVVIMRIGSASPTCKHVAVLLGTPEGPAFRRHSVLQVVNVNSLTEPAVAEAELQPGTYHVVGYSCHDGRGARAVMQKADPGTYARSYASFRIAAGEVVNVGYLHFHASKVGTNAFGRPVRADVEVTDWPLAELDRFKQMRPQIYAKMVTRLMTVTEIDSVPTPADCARLTTLRAEGKVQTLPASCGTAVAKR